MGFRGCKEVEVVSHGCWADPDLVWNDNGTKYCFNYWDIENALWDAFLEETGHSDNDRDEKTEAEFDTFVQGCCVEYLKEVIAGGYFAEGSTSWHDK